MADLGKGDLDEATLAQLDPVVAKLIREVGLQRLGIVATYGWYDDPKRLAFSFARYKFVAKMIDGYTDVLEVGCADGFASRITAQAAGSLTAVDLDGVMIESAKQTYVGPWPIDFRQHDMLAGPVAGKFNAIYSLDVLEHIEPRDERRFLDNLVAPLSEHGLCIIGMPSLQSQAYASKYSKQNHVNCKDQRDFKALMKTYFHTVLAFSANDEIVHTGYHQMSHYNLMVCTGKTSG